MTEAPNTAKRRLDRGEYSPIARVLIDGPDFHKLQPLARHVFLTLKVMMPATGIRVEYPESLAASLSHTTGWPASDVTSALDQLEAAGWIRREAHILWLVGHLEYHPSMSASNPKHRIGVQNHIAGLPRLAIVGEFRQRYAGFFVDATDDVSAYPSVREGIGYRKGMDTLSNPVVVVRSSRSRRSTTASLAGQDAHFDDAFDLFPKRAGSNPRGRALKAWNARRAEGVDAAPMIEGARRYAAYCRATGKEGSEFVMQAARFFGPGREFENAWELPATAPSTDAARILTLHREQQEAEERDEAWLEQRRKAVHAI